MSAGRKRRNVREPRHGIEREAYYRDHYNEEMGHKRHFGGGHYRDHYDEEMGNKHHFRDISHQSDTERQYESRRFRDYEKSSYGRGSESEGRYSIEYQDELNRMGHSRERRAHYEYGRYDLPDRDHQQNYRELGEKYSRDHKMFFHEENDRAFSRDDDLENDRAFSRDGDLENDRAFSRGGDLENDRAFSRDGDLENDRAFSRDGDLEYDRTFSRDGDMFNNEFDDRSSKDNEIEMQYSRKEMQCYQERERSLRDELGLNFFQDNGNKSRGRYSEDQSSELQRSSLKLKRKFPTMQPEDVKLGIECNRLSDGSGPNATDWLIDESQNSASESKYFGFQEGKRYRFEHVDLDFTDDEVRILSEADFLLHRKQLMQGDSSSPLISKSSRWSRDYTDDPHPNSISDNPLTPHTSSILQKPLPDHHKVRTSDSASMEWTGRNLDHPWSRSVSKYPGDHSPRKSGEPNEMDIGREMPFHSMKYPSSTDAGVCSRIDDGRPTRILREADFLLHRKQLMQCDSGSPPISKPSPWSRDYADDPHPNNFSDNPSNPHTSGDLQKSLPDRRQVRTSDSASMEWTGRNSNHPSIRSISEYPRESGEPTEKNIEREMPSNNMKYPRSTDAGACSQIDDGRPIRILREADFLLRRKQLMQGDSGSPPILEPSSPWSRDYTDGLHPNNISDNPLNPHTSSDLQKQSLQKPFPDHHNQRKVRTSDSASKEWTGRNSDRPWISSTSEYPWDHAPWESGDPTKSNTERKIPAYNMKYPSSTDAGVHSRVDDGRDTRTDASGRIAAIGCNSSSAFDQHFTPFLNMERLGDFAASQQQIPLGQFDGGPFLSSNLYGTSSEGVTKNEALFAAAFNNVKMNDARQEGDQNKDCVPANDSRMKLEVSMLPPEPEWGESSYIPLGPVDKSEKIEIVQQVEQEILDISPYRCMTCKVLTTDKAGHLRHKKETSHQEALTNKMKMLDQRLGEWYAAYLVRPKGEIESVRFCTRCMMQYSESREKHRNSDLHKLLVSQLVWYCDDCFSEHPSLLKIENHLCSFRHLRNVSHKLQAAGKIEPEPCDDFQRVGVSYGTNMVKDVQGFTCVVCKSFYCGSINEHCADIEHLWKLRQFITKRKSDEARRRSVLEMEKAYNEIA